MAYKQPRVPPLKEGTGLAEYIRELILFLKDFSLETWVQIRNLQGVKLPESVTQAQVQSLLDAQAKTLREEMAEAKREAIDSALPVGIVVKFATSSDPNALYPWQTWRQITDGRVEIAANDAYPLGSTGGEAAHTLALSELPAHRHGVTTYCGGVGNGAAVQRGWSGETTKSEIDSLPVGEGKAHNNMPPYVARNVWQRTT